MKPTPKLGWMLALALAAGSLCAEDKPVQKIQTLHYIVDYHGVVNGKPETRLEEMWTKGYNYRYEITQKGRKHIAIRLGDIQYDYLLGDQEGSKTKFSDHPTMPNFATPIFQRFESKKKKGKKLGVETVEGIVCDKYEYEETGQKGNQWISQTNQFPVKSIWQFKLKSPQGHIEGTSTVIYRNVEINQDIPDDLFVLPAYVTFSEVNAPGR